MKMKHFFFLGKSVPPHTCVHSAIAKPVFPSEPKTDEKHKNAVLEKQDIIRLMMDQKRPKVRETILSGPLLVRFKKWSKAMIQESGVKQNLERKLIDEMVNIRFHKLEFRDATHLGKMVGRYHWPEKNYQ